ncbi:MAG: hypothetical protein AMJ81_08920 [Phycisphaerae bacterium SM23_33]|nr:MAG: hypothetical protein AMJ81_08920 [Phycisphaerae bacterium SM23_33]
MCPGNENRHGDSHRLRLLFWESTGRCNLSCVHCRRLHPDHDPGDELTTEQARGVIDSAAGMGRPIFVFSGGEPLLRDDWAELARHAKDKGLMTALATNGTLVDPPLAGRVAAAGFHRVSVSLDAAEASSHDRFRGVPGAFEAAISGIKALRQAGAAVQINATICESNVGQLPRLYALAGRLGAVALHLFLLVPVGCGMAMSEDEFLAPTECESVLEWVVRRQAGGEIELKATCAPHYYRVAKQWLTRHADDDGAERVRSGIRSRGCLAGVGVIFVSHSGEVFPCGYLPVSCGSILERDLAGIWENSEVLRRLRDYDLLTGKCGRCEFKTVESGVIPLALGRRRRTPVRA